MDLPLVQRCVWKGIGMTGEQLERLVQSFERIAESLGAICVNQQRRYEQDYPERKEPRDAVITRIKTEDDLVKERQGATNEPVGEWLTGYEDSEFIGAREKAFLEDQAKERHAGAEADGVARSGGAGAEASRRKVRTTRKHPPAESHD